MAGTFVAKEQPVQRLSRRSALALLLLVAALAACSEPASTTVVKIEPDAHDVYFPITQGNHEGLACDSCHTNPERTRFSCIGCHKHEADVTNPIHVGIDGYAWGPESCYACHPRGEATGAGANHEAIFPIAPETAHAGIACMDCHVTREDRSQLLCATCHEEAVTTPLHADLGGFRHESPRCVRCHADAQIDEVDTHPVFQIAAGSAHFGSNCVQCHTALRADKPFGADFLTQSCTGNCHPQAVTDPLHGATPGYLYATGSCLTCHPTGSVTGMVDHVRYFPIDVGSHATFACGECHRNPEDRDDVTCAGTCHADALVRPPHAGKVPGFELRSSACLRCHADSQVTPVAQHGPFSIGEGTSHHDTSCLDCHTQSRVDKPFGADFGKQSCINCHERTPTNLSHDLIPEYEWLSTACILCHPVGAAPGRMDHTRFFPIGPGAAHRASEQRCKDCHRQPGVRRALTCTDGSCHPAATATRQHAATVPDFALVSMTCARCHATSQVEQTSAHTAFRIDAGAPHDASACLECHPSWRTDKPWGASFSQQTCTGCHDRATTSGIHGGMGGYEWSTGACLLCHPDGSVGAAVDHTGFFPIGATTAHREVPCAECHSDPVVHERVACATCHTAVTMSAAHLAVRGFAQSSPSCLRCHADAQVDPVASHGSPVFRIASGRHQKACYDCHTSDRADRPYEAIDFTPFDCFGGCHEHVRSDIDRRHAGEPNYDGTSAGCLQNGCHPDGRTP